MEKTSILKKVIAWRCISILVTLSVLYVGTGSVKSATGLTFLLHAILIACHYTFEKIWERGNESRRFG